MLYRSNRRKHRTILAASFILSVISTSSQAAETQGRAGETDAKRNAAADSFLVSETSRPHELRAA